MQIGANTPSNVDLNTMHMIPADLRDAMDVDVLVRGYYSHLSATAPAYEDPDFPALPGSQAELDIRDQLVTLTEKAVSLLAAYRPDFSDANKARVNSFGDKIRNAELPMDERLHFYGRPFKTAFERKVALADRESGRDDGVALQGRKMKELQEYCFMLSQPSLFVEAATSGKPIQDYMEAFADIMDKAAAESNTPPMPPFALA
ncbi:hypothetical protein BOSP111201_10885 [Bordetella sputigena]|uniref:hypothetical protein n=1 Tax=Bordetella sputigena TaxID=1416810 RepID=UPI0039F03179